MWPIALALAATPPDALPGYRPMQARQAVAVVRIVKPARVRLGEVATDRDDLQIRATDTTFRTADGTDRPARIVEFP